MATRDLMDLFRIALMPVGTTMYIWGGGWNEEDTGSGEDTCKLGPRSRWADYAAQQDATYDYNQTRFQIHDGLDCSGYMGWVLYNLMEDEDGRPGYVCSATEMAADCAKRGFGTFTPIGEVTHWQAGDVMSSRGHVWLVVGTCPDGSVVLLHSSPPGVRLSGTKLEGQDTPSQAEALAIQYMSLYYPAWQERYPDVSKPADYLTGSARMRWHSTILSDAEGLAALDAAGVLKKLFHEP